MYFDHYIVNLYIHIYLFFFPCLSSDIVSHRAEYDTVLIKIYMLLGCFFYLSNDRLHSLRNIVYSV